MRTIRLICLDDIIEQLGVDHLDCLKVDICGHEPQFLEVAVLALCKFTQASVIAFNQANLDAAGHELRELNKCLEEFGYELWTEQFGQPSVSRFEFLVECGSFTHSVVYGH